MKLYIKELYSLHPKGGRIMKINYNIEINTQKLLLSSILIIIGVFSRIILHDFFNSINNPWAESGFLDVFFVIATVSVFSAILLGKYYTIAIPLIEFTLASIFDQFVTITESKFIH